MIWYGFCTYWTDDWDKLSTQPVPPGSKFPGIPCCPDCGSVGYQMEEDEWWEGVQAFEAENPGYYKYIKAIKDTCHGKGISIGDLWEEYQKGEKNEAQSGIPGEAREG